MTRAELRKRIKISFGLDEDREDGNLSDTNFNLAIAMAIRQVAYDCSLLPEMRKFATEVDKWKYPMDDDVDLIRSAWYIDSNTRIPLTYCSAEEFYDYLDPTSTGDTPAYFTYPMMQSEVFEFWAGAPDVYDYVLSSHITSTTVRTVVDTGINFGLTRQGKRVVPGCIVHNLTDDSYGYVETLDITTNITTGTATTSTNTNTLYDTGKDFTALGVQVGDIICTPSTGIVTGYAFVTAVGTTTLTYTSFQATNTAVAFSSGNTYKVGKATEIRLKGTTPHPGLRSGARNYFSVGSELATITGSTTFTNTRATGTVSSGASTGDIAVASGGSHGKITDVEDTYVDVNYWIGGKPTDGETVSIKDCDEYHVETKERTQRAIWIGPTPSASDTVGTESLEILYTSTPTIPDKDSDVLEIPDKYEQPLQRAGEWQAAILTGTFSRMELDGYERTYKMSVLPYKHDIFRPPMGRQLTVWGNRHNVRNAGRKYQLRNYAWQPKTS